MGVIPPNELAHRWRPIGAITVFSGTRRADIRCSAWFGFSAATR
jgi:hypothetical protein